MRARILSKVGYSVLSYSVDKPAIVSRCVNSLPKPICPLCRTKFEPQDIRKLHIDRGQTPRPPLASTETVDMAQSLHDARGYQTDITRIVRVGAPASELKALIDQCHIWLKNQPPDQVTMASFPHYEWLKANY